MLNKNNLNLTNGLLGSYVAVIQFGESVNDDDNLKEKIHVYKNIGMNVREIKFNEKSSESEVIDMIEVFNVIDNCYKIHIQQPLPKHIDVNRVVGSIRPYKKMVVHSKRKTSLFVKLFENIELLVRGVLKTIV